MNERRIGFARHINPQSPWCTAGTMLNPALLPHSAMWHQSTTRLVFAAHPSNSCQSGFAPPPRCAVSTGPSRSRTRSNPTIITAKQSQPRCGYVATRHAKSSQDEKRSSRRALRMWGSMGLEKCRFREHGRLVDTRREKGRKGNTFGFTTPWLTKCWHSWRVRNSSVETKMSLFR